MPIPNADTIPPRGIGKYVPNYFKDKTYVRVSSGDVKTITYVVKKSYQAKDKDYQPIFSKVDGSPVMRVVYYLGFDDDTYTTVKNDIVIGQCDAWLSVYDDADNAEYNLFELDEVTKVRFAERMHKMGAKEYPVPVLEVL